MIKQLRKVAKFAIREVVGGITEEIGIQFVTDAVNSFLGPLIGEEGPEIETITQTVYDPKSLDEIKRFITHLKPSTISSSDRNKYNGLEFIDIKREYQLSHYNLAREIYQTLSTFSNIEISISKLKGTDEISYASAILGYLETYIFDGGAVNIPAPLVNMINGVNKTIQDMKVTDHDGILSDYAGSTRSFLLLNMIMGRLEMELIKIGLTLNLSVYLESNMKYDLETGKYLFHQIAFAYMPTMLNAIFHESNYTIDFINKVKSIAFGMASELADKYSKGKTVIISEAYDQSTNNKQSLYDYLAEDRSVLEIIAFLFDAVDFDDEATAYVKEQYSVAASRLGYDGDTTIASEVAGIKSELLRNDFTKTVTDSLIVKLYGLAIDPVINTLRNKVEQQLLSKIKSNFLNRVGNIIQNL